MTTKEAVLLFLVSFIALYLSVSATLPSPWGQGTRRPGYWQRPGQQRPSTHDEHGDNPYNPDYPHRPGYTLRPGYPHRPGYPQPGYPQQPGYPGSHGVYPERNCQYGRPCDETVGDEDYDQTGGGTGLDLGGFGDGDGYEEDDHSSYGQSGCSCLLYVEYTVVYRRVNNRQRFSCNRYGLQRCSRYCDELFQNEGIRASSRQDACDVLGREIHTPWYRKDQVCGSRGLHTDIPLQRDLCCRRGRPSLDCEDTDFEEP